MTRSTLCGAAWGKDGVGREHDDPNQLIPDRDAPYGEAFVGQSILTK